MSEPDLRARIEALHRDITDPNPEADQDWHDDPLGCIADAIRAALAARDYAAGRARVREAAGPCVRHRCSHPTMKVCEDFIAAALDAPEPAPGLTEAERESRDYRRLAP